MMELDHGKVYLYEANYDKFLELKALRIKEEAKAMQKLKSVLKKETEWMNRSVEARRTKSKSRIERFEELSKIEFNENEKMSFSSKSRYLGKGVLKAVENVNTISIDMDSDLDLSMLGLEVREVIRELNNNN